MTTKKERREALGRMTKAELVKTVVALDARQTKLLNEVTHAKEVAEAHSAVAVALQRQVQSLQGRLDNAHATATGAALPEACGLCDVTTKPPHCEVPGCTAHVAGTLPPEQDAIDSEQEERRRVFGPFPWEQE